MANVLMKRVSPAARPTYVQMDFGVEPDGALSVPRFVAAGLDPATFSPVEGELGTVDTRAELEAEDIVGLQIFLCAHGRSGDLYEPAVPPAIMPRRLATEELRVKALALFDAAAT